MRDLWLLGWTTNDYFSLDALEKSRVSTLRKLPPLNALRAFEAAARHLSFSRAADELHVTPAAISHQVKTLEGFLGVKLFRRLPRALRLTAEGNALYPELTASFDRLGRAIERVQRRGVRGHLTMSTTPTFAISWLVPRIKRFNEDHPGIKIALVTTVQVADFTREDVDVAVRYGRGPWPGLRCSKLFDDRLTPLCGDRWAQKMSQPADLVGAPLLTISGQDHRRTWLRAAGLVHPHVDDGPAFESNANSHRRRNRGDGSRHREPLVARRPPGRRPRGPDVRPRCPERGVVLVRLPRIDG